MKQILFTLALASSILLSASIDGKWVAEMEQRRQQAEGKKAQVTMEFKSSGSALTGTVSAGRKGRAVDIQNGKLDGDRFSFETTQKTKKGDVKLVWSGSASSNELKGQFARDGRKRTISFTAKRP